MTICVRMALLLGIALASISATRPRAIDLIIRGGTIYNGSDAQFTGDIGVDPTAIRRHNAQNQPEQDA